MSQPQWVGGWWGGGARCVLAPNPGPMTLEGTNTWLLASPGSASAAVVDPGPADEGHLAAVVAAAAQVQAAVTVILLTHGHPDHAQGARRLAQMCRAPVRALDPAQQFGSQGLADGDVVAVADLELRVIATPGHTWDSLSFLLTGPGPGAAALLTGDTVLGRGSTVIAHPDGRLREYLTSLQTLRACAVGHGVAAVLPGHGPVLTDPVAAIDGYLEHRRVRLEQVAAAVAGGARTAAEVVRAVYADVDPVLWPAATLSVEAHLDYLAGR